MIGIGLNVSIEPDEFPADLRWPATSVGAGADVAAVRDAVCAALGRWVDAPQAEALGPFRRRDALPGREIAWDGTGDEPGDGHRRRRRRARQPAWSSSTAAIGSRSARAR